MGSDLGSSQIKTEILANRRWRIAFVVIAIAAALLYFIGLPNNPPGFYIDESSIAFNADNIAKNGSDEFGVRWPLYFRAFGDYKNPIYVYLLAAIFRLTSPGILAARLLSATLGILAGAAIGLLAARLTRNRAVGWLMAATALLTPWLFETSRVVMEVALYPLLVGVFLLCVHRVSVKPKWSRVDKISLATTLALLTYAYSIGRLLGPLLALGLAFFVTQDRWRDVVRTWLLYGVSLIPLIIFNDTHPGALTQRFKIITYLTPGGSAGETVIEFCRHFLANANLRRLLISGDPNRDQVAHIIGTPHFLLATFVFAIAGAFVVLKDRLREPWWRFVLYGLFVALVPASLTNESFHMLRLIAVPVFLLVFAAAGMAIVPRGLFLILLLLTIAQAAAFQWKFHQSAGLARRVHLFDAQYRARIFDPAIASGQRPIYLADALAIPGYIQAYWYATLAHIDRAQFVLLSPDQTAPAGALVITTEENCPRCEMLARVKPYTLYRANGPPRVREPLPENGFRADLSVIEAPRKFRAGKLAKILVRVKNSSGATWLARERSGGPLQVSLGNRWLDANGKTVIGDDGRSALLQDLRPGDEVDLRLTVKVPRQIGDYILELDMLQESVSWFGLKGSRTERLAVRVE